MFLSEVEATPLGGGLEPRPPAGEAPPGILRLIAYKPEQAAHLGRLAEAVMRGPSPLTPWQREMIATLTSKGNRTSFCMHAHAAATAALAGDDALVRAVLEDVERAPVSPRERALFRFVQRVTADPSATRQEDVDAVLAAGWPQEAVFDAITVCALFKFYNTWVSATGVSDVSAPGFAASGARLARHGYASDVAPAGAAGTP